MYYTYAHSFKVAKLGDKLLIQLLAFFPLLTRIEMQKKSSHFFPIAEKTGEKAVDLKKRKANAFTMIWGLGWTAKLPVI